AKRTKKPKKKSEDQQEEEVPLTHYIQAVGPDGTPLIVEVKDTDLTPEEKQKVVKKIEQQKSKPVTETVPKEYVEVTGPDGKPFVVQVLQAKPTLSEE
ncbi:unnamed protein product, partial [Allacma fusca]